MLVADTILITGANRGLGLEHVRCYAERGHRVLACCRQPDAAGPLQSLQQRFPGLVRVLRLDVTSGEDVAGLVADLDGQPLDVLLNNAGTYGPQGAPAGMAYQSLQHMDYGIWRQILEVNLLAPFRLTVALLPNLRAGARRLVVMMSSDLGSISNNSQGGSYAYRSSKAGLNMLARGMAAEWRDLIVVAMAPGWSRTELGGAGAPVDPADSVRAQQAVLASLSLEDSGQFLDRFGARVAW